MKKVIVLYVILIAALAINGCEGDKIKQLNDQMAALASDNTTLKAKIGDLEKARAEMEVKLGVLQADRDQAKKALDECAAKTADKDGPKVKDNGKGNGKDKIGGNGKKTAAVPAKKPVFKAPTRAK